MIMDITNDDFDKAKELFRIYIQSISKKNMAFSPKTLTLSVSMLKDFTSKLLVQTGKVSVEDIDNIWVEADGYMKNNSLIIKEGE